MTIGEVNYSNFELNSLVSLSKLGRSSNSAHRIIKLHSRIPLQVKYKKLLFRKRWLSGRTNSGRISVFTKGGRSKKKMPFLNYNFRFTSLFFVGGINYTYFNDKISSLIFNSTGLVSYVPARSKDKYFLITRLKGMAFLKSNLFRGIMNIKPYINIPEIPFMLIQQKKNKSISFVELHTLKGSDYARSIGSCAKIIKLDTRTGLSLVKLPSGIRKIFSAFSLSQEGSANLLLLQNKFGNTKSGY